MGENLKSDPKFFLDKVNFQMKPSRVVNIGSGNVGRRYVMRTYSADNHKSKICTYGLALSCAGLKGLKTLTVVEGGVGSLGAPQKMKLPSKFRYLMR